MRELQFRDVGRAIGFHKIHPIQAREKLGGNKHGCDYCEDVERLVHGFLSECLVIITNAATKILESREVFAGLINMVLHIVKVKLTILTNVLVVNDAYDSSFERLESPDDLLKFFLNFIDFF